MRHRGTENRAGRSHPEWSKALALRINSLDLIRACEQTALVMNMFRGRGVQVRTGAGIPKQAQRPAIPRIRAGAAATVAQVWRWGCQSLLGYMAGAECDGRIVQPDVEMDEGWKPERIGRVALCKAREATERQGQEGWQLDFVVLPVSGVKDLVDGHGGAISCIVGAPRFGDTDPFLPQFCGPDGDPHGTGHYLVVVRAPGPERIRLRINEAGLPTKGEPVLVDDGLERVLSVQPTEVKGDHRPVTIGLMSPPVRSAAQDYRNTLRHLLGWSACTHTFFGSPVAAGLAACLPHWRLDGFVGIVTRAEATAIAVAAGTVPTDGARPEEAATFQALPVFVRTGGAKGSRGPTENGAATPDTLRSVDGTPKGPRSSMEFVFRAGTAVLDRSAFARSDYPFLIATGITENVAVRGVRYTGPNEASTHTLLLRSGTRTVRSIVNCHDLTAKLVHLYRSGQCSARSVRYSVIETKLRSRWLKQRPVAPDADKGDEKPPGGPCNPDQG